MKVESIKNIAVVGAGIMGQGIAQACALSGYPVMLYDTQPDLINAAIASIRKSLDERVGKDELDINQKNEALSLIEAVGDFRQLQVDLAVEAVSEKLELKQKIVSELEKLNAKDCILVSTTSSFPVALIASVLKHKDRFAGLHFFNPAPVIRLVEIIKGAATAQHTLDILKLFADSISKPSVMVNDSPGFIVNRVARLYFLESLKIADERVSDFKTIDDLCVSTGFKMGPFELMDAMGVDTNLEVTTSLYQAFYQEPKFKPSRLQQHKVDAGHCGRKSGKGFYEYPT
jgi:3-hydroxybutyryl-CoA dehydrogenase